MTTEQPSAVPDRSDLYLLYEAAVLSDDRGDWHAVWQALAGTMLRIPLQDAAGDTIRPVLEDDATGASLTACVGAEIFAQTLIQAQHHAELPGGTLAAMLAGADVPISLVVVSTSGTFKVDPATLRWIGETFTAEVDRADAAGATLAAPTNISPALIVALGSAVGALGQDCPEAWLVSMTETGRTPELVLVLGLSDAVRSMEAELAEAVTRSVQSVSDRPVAVACADRASALMASARRSGIGIGGGE